MDFADQSLYLHGHKHRLSSPIFVDIVACYGPESKLTECSYHTDTSEDDHDKDVWVKCDKEDTNVQPHGDVERNSAISLAAFFILVIILIMMVATVIAIKCSKKGKGMNACGRQAKKSLIFIV